MGTSLDKLIRNSLRGYIDDPGEIDELFTKLLNKKVGEFSGSAKEGTLKSAKDLMDDFQMASERCAELTYADILCLTNGILNRPDYPIIDKDTRIDIFQTMLHLVRALLMTSAKTDPEVRLFMSVTVSGYFRYLAKKSGAEDPYNAFMMRVDMNMDYSLSEDTTIGTYLEKLERFQSRRWLPFFSIIQFENDIRSGFDDLGFLLIKHVRKAFPEYFDIDKLKLRFPRTSPDECNYEEKGE